jgi:hypothetical protein
MRFHIALSATDVEAAVADYRIRLGVEPVVTVRGTYALFRTELLNLSIRRDSAVPPGQLRHLGWEDPNASTFSKETDSLGIVWERFDSEAQAKEIEAAWPGTDCSGLRRH